LEGDAEGGKSSNMKRPIESCLPEQGDAEGGK